MSLTNIPFRPTTQDSVLCWKCGDMINLNQDLFCNSCEVVQKPFDDANYFEILSIGKQFDVDAKELTKKFRLLQMQLQPDRFTQKSEDEKTVSSSYSSMLNQAYKILQSPLARGLYLLELEGYVIEERDNHVEPEFLFEIMELNEELDEIENREDLFK